MNTFGPVVIRITKFPEKSDPSGCPKEFIENWIGLTLPALQINAYGYRIDLSHPELSRQEERKSFVATLDVIVEALRQKSPRAAEWFLTQDPPLEFYFYTDEVEVQSIH